MFQGIAKAKIVLQVSNKLNMGFEKRRTLSLKVELPNLESLGDLSAELTTIPKSSFIFKYGDILDLLFTNVQANAITSLSQLYDPLMRSFIFQDFLLAPTIEEFKRIVGIPPKGRGPYVEIGHPPKVEKLVETLNIKVSGFASNVKTRRKAPDFLQSYPEKKAREFAVS